MRFNFPAAAGVLVAILETSENAAGFRSLRRLGKSDEVQSALSELVGAGIISTYDPVNSQCRLSAEAARASKRSFRVVPGWKTLTIWTVPYQDGGAKEVKIASLEDQIWEVDQAEILSGLLGRREVLLWPSHPKKQRLWVKSQFL